MQVRAGHLLDTRQRPDLDLAEFGKIHHRRGQHLQTIAACGAARLRERGLDELLHVVLGHTTFFTAAFDLVNRHTEFARESAYGGTGMRFAPARSIRSPHRLWQLSVGAAAGFAAT